MATVSVLWVIPYALFHLAAVLPMMSDIWTFEPFPETRANQIQNKSTSTHSPPSPLPMHFRNRYITVPLLKQSFFLFFFTGTHKQASYLDITEPLRARMVSPLICAFRQCWITVSVVCRKHGKCWFSKSEVFTNKSWFSFWSEEIRV